MTVSATRLLVTSRSRLVQLSLAVAGSLLLWLSAKVQVPFYPVPMTMQTFALLLLAASTGRIGVAAVALYLLEGAFGLPVFAGTPEKGLGLAYMTGPTGGYLLGFLLAAAFVAWMAEKGWMQGFVSRLVVMGIGAALIYLPGLAWLSAFIGFDKAVALGLMPFIYGDLLKVLLAAVALQAAWRLKKA